MKTKIEWKTLLFILIVHLVALLGFVYYDQKAFIAFLLFYFITGSLGISIGFHRLLTHRSFKCPKWLEYFLAICGTLALQQSPLEWVATHRCHHAYSDIENDPHSPREGFWWAHVLWLFKKNESFYERKKYEKWCPDLSKKPFYVFLYNHLLLPNIILGIILYYFGGISSVIWGIFVRLVFVYHTTWLVNSACHVFGKRDFNTMDTSRNLWWVALLTFGEGWHNNHHAFPTSAKHGLKSLQLDVNYIIIDILRKLKIASDVKLYGQQYK